MRKLSSAGLEYLLVPDKAENSSVLDKAENPLVADNGKNPFVPVKIDPDNDEIFLFWSFLLYQFIGARNYSFMNFCIPKKINSREVS